ncbi:DIS3-like exonuclease 2 [Quillaja saponaria]|uniref:DIS3-like exonuclease 2 n=1 Tax=Quillaja saponaria TaxID=32244 RepID=A0AAD7LWH1_QUISA|nr:DIS3-like exonuclease 2 [Quillaja saponaria]
MTSTLGWYGPLIDLSKAASHIGDFVQLLVFVHRSVPVQYKSSSGGEVIRTDIQVGDDTRQFFAVSLWKKQMGSMVSAGDIILLQNVKIAKFGDCIEARTVQWSSLSCLIHPYESLVSRGIEDLILNYHGGITTKTKLRKVIEWVQQAGSTLCNNKLLCYRENRHLSRNWKLPEERTSRDCFLLSEVSCLTNTFKAKFCASVGEIFLGFTTRTLENSEKEKLLLSRRFDKMRDDSLVEDLICTGCQLCGSTMDSVFEQNAIPLNCSKSSNRLHAVSLIYRPFMLYVWDESEYMALLVKNRAAEILFGNIKAEKVYLCYREQMHDQNPNLRDDIKVNNQNARASHHSKPAGKGVLGSCSSDAHRSLKKKQCDTNFYLIWLILLKMLVQQGKNSPLKFEIIINASLDNENGKFEMVSASMPCFKIK